MKSLTIYKTFDFFKDIKRLLGSQAMTDIEIFNNANICVFFTET